MARSPEIGYLLSLLDDEDESIAVDAMAELLQREDELGDALAELQESPNPLFRRRGQRPCGRRELLIHGQEHSAGDRHPPVL